MNKKFKPPDQYKCIKVPIIDILRKDVNNNNSNIMLLLDNTVIKTNKIIIKTYQLLRLWLLEKYHNNLDIPIITEDIIKLAMKSISTKQIDKRILNKDILNEFINLSSFMSKEDSINLSSVLQSYQTIILTSIENNIKLHFIEYTNRFINSYFKKLYSKEIESDKEFKNQLFKELNTLKKDIIDETNLSNEKYKEFLKVYRDKIIPKCPEESMSHYANLRSRPQSYIKHMIFMNIELERLECKMYQFFPLQTNVGLNNIPLDTKALIDIFVISNQNKYLKDIEGSKDFIWSEFFQINQKLKDYVFDYCIITDGFFLSL